MVFKRKARFTFDGKNIPDEQVCQADIKENGEFSITDDQTNLGTLNDESNVLVEAFETIEENNIEYETESGSENDED